MKCSKCGVELVIVSYGSKVGKDGRVAKWAIYEKCEHLKVRPDAPLPDFSPKNFNYEPMAPHKDLSGVMFQSWKPILVESDLEPIIKEFKEKYEGNILNVQMNEKDLPEGWESWTIPVVRNNHLTPKYRYVFVIPEGEVKRRE
jgi:hypothetical protein